MTIAEKILLAVNHLLREGKTSFTRVEIRDYLGIDRTIWNASYNPIFQGMRIDHPGGAPGVSEKYKNVFRRIEPGIYNLTDHGKRFIEGNADQHNPHNDFDLFIPVSEARLSDQDDNPQYQATISRRHIIYKEKVQLILENADSFHQAFYRSEIFGNPCLYFHLQALKHRHDPTSEKFAEYAYATLIAWGMNRPGRAGSKMQNFETFFTSINSMKDNIIFAQKFEYANMDNSKWMVLESIFKGIKVMESKTSLIGNSKVMHHMLPNIIPPIDRQYTLTFLQGNSNIRNNLDSEWLIMKNIISDFFIPIVANIDFLSRTSVWMHNQIEYKWDTSPLKVIDNIIIGGLRQ